MDTTKKHSWAGALVAPVLSLALLGSVPDAAQAESRNFLDKIFSGNRAAASARSRPLVADLDPRVIQLEDALRDLTRQVEALNLNLLHLQNRIDVLEGRSLDHPTKPQLEETAQNSAVVTIKPQEQTQGEMVDLRLAASHRLDMRNGASAEYADDGEEDVVLDESKVPQTQDAKELYRLGYQYMLSGDYRMAEHVFRAFQTRFPDDAQIGDAGFWLGEALYGQGRYREAAQIYIDVQRLHQNASYSPENLLKLGMSMAQLNETDVACKTLSEVPKRYARAEPAILKRIADEKTRLHCP